MPGSSHPSCEEPTAHRTLPLSKEKDSQTNSRTYNKGPTLKKTVLKDAEPESLDLTTKKVHSIGQLKTPTTRSPRKQKSKNEVNWRN